MMFCSLLSLLLFLLFAVLFQDFESYTPHDDTIHPVKWDGLWYVMAVTIYSMEGVGLILSLKGSAKNQQQFPKLFIVTIAIISLFMACKFTCDVELDALVGGLTVT